MIQVLSLLLLVSVGHAAPKPGAKTAPARPTVTRAAVAKPVAKAGATQSFSAREPANRDGLPANVDRSTSIDFEDDIIEGMNKNPFDSLTRVGRQDGANGAHLYHRKKGFGRELKQTVREMGYAP